MIISKHDIITMATTLGGMVKCPITKAIASSFSLLFCHRVHQNLLSVFARGVEPSCQLPQDEVMDDEREEVQEEEEERNVISRQKQRESSNSSPDDIVRSSDNLLNT